LRWSQEVRNEILAKDLFYLIVTSNTPEMRKKSMKPGKGNFWNSFLMKKSP